MLEIFIFVLLAIAVYVIDKIKRHTSGTGGCNDCDNDYKQSLRDSKW